MSGDEHPQPKKRRAKVAGKRTGAKQQNASDAQDSTDLQAKQKQGRYVLFVGNLPYSADRNRLQSFFKHAQPSSEVEVRMLTHKATGEPKGAAFVEFKDGAALAKALRLHKSDLDGRKIRVELSAGGGGKSQARQDRIKEKQKALLQERDTAWKRRADSANASEHHRKKQKKGEGKGRSTEASKPPESVVEPPSAEIVEFCQKFGLTSADATSYLQRLSPQVLEVVLSTFKLREGARDPTAILVRFGEAVKRRMDEDIVETQGDTGESQGQPEEASSKKKKLKQTASITKTKGKKIIEQKGSEQQLASQSETEASGIKKDPIQPLKQMKLRKGKASHDIGGKAPAAASPKIAETGPATKTNQKKKKKKKLGSRQIKKLRAREKKSQEEQS
eukprot:gnl/MRDRNA2_/MRDRNA2_134787_c0_seq1.p1 gnl/MRDRNA2_/MRDRNA2_134787_c0~~gnl/MRDRNA2_/MRDRNA2_134787_c0_seq1.p1  ORF type:complete len:412 (+),score=104.73 gnl/MRDRNA2_/MRDRNA2_134787_c0_seq1:68-1237(+)